jgi:hypothetical protein
MNGESVVSIRVPGLLSELWANRGRAGRWLARQLVPNLGTLLLVGVLLWVSGVYAAPGASPAQPAGTSFTTVNYQGRLADRLGTPIDDTVSLTFALYETETGGTAVWSESHSAVPVSDGLFSVRLGQITPLSADLLAENLWLEVQVDTDPPMTPREKLAAVPYAMQAGLALTVPQGSINNQRIVLQRYYVPMSVPDHFALTSTEQVIGETTINLPYAATYIIFLTYATNGHGGRSILYVRDENGNYICNLDTTSDSVMHTAKTCFYELPAGTHTFKLLARTASSFVGQEVRVGTEGIIIPIAQAP